MGKSSATAAKTETKSPTKAELAREIYAVYGADESRKQIIERFMKDLGMSKAGASTYFHNVKTAAAKANVDAGSTPPATEDNVGGEGESLDPLRVIEGESAKERKNRIRREKRALANS